MYKQNMTNTKFQSRTNLVTYLTVSTGSAQSLSSDVQSCSTSGCTGAHRAFTVGAQAQRISASSACLFHPRSPAQHLNIPVLQNVRCPPNLPICRAARKFVASSPCPVTRGRLMPSCSSNSTKKSRTMTKSVAVSAMPTMTESQSQTGELLISPRSAARPRPALRRCLGLLVC